MQHVLKLCQVRSPTSKLHASRTCFLCRAHRKSRSCTHGRPLPLNFDARGPLNWNTTPEQFNRNWFHALGSQFDHIFLRNWTISLAPALIESTCVIRIKSSPRWKLWSQSHGANHVLLLGVPWVLTSLCRHRSKPASWISPVAAR
jgi:hypothetical protein